MPKPDYQAFAGSFLDLWQTQISRAMSDTDFLQTLMDNMQQMQQGMFSHDAGSQQTPEHPAHASRAGDDELADLRRRVATAERKITLLESRIERLSGKGESSAEAAPKAAAKAAAKTPYEPPTPKRAGSTGRTGGAAAVAKPVAAQHAAAKPASKPSKKPRKRAIKRR